MPRAVDTQQLLWNHDPTRNGTEFHLSSFQQIDDLIAQILAGLLDSFKNLIIPALEEFLGIDLSLLRPLLDALSLDFSSPAAFFTSIIEALIALPEILIVLLTSLIEALLSLDAEELFNSLLTELVTLLVSLPDLLGSLLTAVLNLLESFTGIDLTVFLPLWQDLDLSDPVSFFISLTSAILATGAGLLGPNSPLNAANLFGILQSNVFGAVPIGSLVDVLSNIVPLGGLFQLGSIAPGGGWLVDMLTGVSSDGGSAQVNADGALHGLLGVLTTVVPGQILDLSVMTKWTGLTSVGGSSPIQFGLVGLLAGAPVLNTVLDTITSPGSSSSGWQSLAGQFTVPAGIDAIRLRLRLTGDATTGTVWFSGVTATQPGKIIQEWVTDLPEQFQGVLDILGLGVLGDLIGPNVDAVWTQLIDTIINPLGTIRDALAQINIQETINLIIQAVEGFPIVGGSLAEMFTAVEEIFDTALDGQALGTDALGQIDDLLGDLLTIPATILGNLPQTKITNLPTDLTNLHSLAQSTLNNVWATFGATAHTPGVTPDKTIPQLVSAGQDFVRSLSEGAPYNVINFENSQTETRQVKQILAGQIITPINSLLTTIKSWYDTNF